MDYILTKTTFTGVTDDNKTITMSSSNVNWDELYEAIIMKEWGDVEFLCDLPAAVNHYGQGKISVIGGMVQYKGVDIHNSMTSRILDMMSQGIDVDPMLQFLENMLDNPSNRSIKDLYRFMEHNSLPITSDGNFLAYKMVSADFKDCRTGTMDNSVGSTVEMERRDVEDNPDVTCSTGLHFCSVDYLSSHWGNTIVIVKINPADVVSIPTDYNNAKGRACKYQVVGIHAHGHTEDTLAESSVNTDYDTGFDDGYSEAKADYDW
tara:strand:- start:11 stop:799 length:789 start_codon:yes stop_codon:yes gene_type:complete